MALFTPKTTKTAPAEKKPKYEDLREKLKKAVQVHAIDWMSREFCEDQKYPVFSTKKVKEKVEKFLHHAFESMIMEAVGLEAERFDHGYKVKYDSPLKAVIKQVANTEAAAMVEKMMASQEKNLPSRLPPKFRTALEKAYEEAFYRAAVSAASTRGAQKAEEDIDKILGETK